jgi:hypothetical protein
MNAECYMLRPVPGYPGYPCTHISHECVVCLSFHTDTGNMAGMWCIHKAYILPSYFSHTYVDQLKAKIFVRSKKFFATRLPGTRVHSTHVY